MCNMLQRCRCWVLHIYSLHIHFSMLKLHSESLYDPYICILQLRVVLGVPDNTTLLQPSDHIIVLMQWDTAEADKVKAE